MACLLTFPLIEFGLQYFAGASSDPRGNLEVHACRSPRRGQQWIPHMGDGCQLVSFLKLRCVVSNTSGQGHGDLAPEPEESMDTSLFNVLRTGLHMHTVLHVLRHLCIVPPTHGRP